jgi:hypothetical protein
MVYVIDVSSSLNIGEVIRRTLKDSIISSPDINLDTLSARDLIYATFPKFHSNIAFFVGDTSDLFSAIESSRVADVVLLAVRYNSDYTQLISEV